MMYKRYSHACAIVTNANGEKEVVVAGGSPGSRDLDDTIEILDVKKNTWRLKREKHPKN